MGIEGLPSIREPQRGELIRAAQLQGMRHIPRGRDCHLESPTVVKTTDLGIGRGPQETARCRVVVQPDIGKPIRSFGNLRLAAKGERRANILMQQAGFDKPTGAALRFELPPVSDLRGVKRGVVVPPLEVGNDPGHPLSQTRRLRLEPSILAV